jgi:hypothetical protein
MRVQSDMGHLEFILFLLLPGGFVEVWNRQFRAGTFARDPLMRWLDDPSWRTEIKDGHVVLACYEHTYTTISLPRITEYPLSSLARVRLLRWLQADAA